jgi:hypothetical protein
VDPASWPKRRRREDYRYTGQWTKPKPPEIPIRLSSTTSSSDCTLVCNHYLWFSSHKSGSMKWFSKQSATVLVFSLARHLLPKRAMNSWWWLWSILLMKILHSGTCGLRCDCGIPYFHFPSFECLSVDQLPDGCLGPTVLPFYMPDFLFTASGCLLTNDLPQEDHTYVWKHDFTFRQPIY